MLKKVIALVIISLGLIYLGIPTIVSSIGPGYLTDNLGSDENAIEFSRLDIQHPGLSNLSIDHLKFEFDSYLVEIRKMDTNYAFDEFTIDLLTITLAPSQQSENRDLSIPSLPKIVTDKLFAQVPDISGSIKQLILVSGQNQVHLDALTINVMDQSQLIFNTKALDFSQIELAQDSLLTPFAIQHDVSGKLIATKENLSYEINSNFLSFGGQYQNNVNDIVVDLTLQHEMLQQVFVSKITDKASLISPINIRYLQPNEDNDQATIELSTGISTVYEPVESASVNIKLAEIPGSGHVNIDAELASVLDTNSSLIASVGFALVPLQDDWQFKNLTIVNKVNDWNRTFNNYLVTFDNLEASTSPQDLLLSDLRQKSVSLAFTTNEINASVTDTRSDEKVLVEPIKLRFSLAGSTKNFEQVSFQSELNISGIQHEVFKPSSELSIELNEVQIDIADMNTTFEFSLFDPGGMMSDYRYDSIYMESNGSYSQTDLNLSGKLILNGGFSLPFTTTYNIDTQTGEMNFPEQQNKITNLNGLISQVTKETFDQSSFVKGNVSHQGKLYISDNISGDFNISLSDADFEFDESIATAIGVDSKLHIKDNNASFQSDVSLNNLELSSDLEIKDIQLNVISVNDDNAIRNLSAGLFDGILKSQPITIRKGQIEPAIITLSEIALFKLVSFLNLESLYADGALEIIMPLSSDEEAIIVSNGTFKNTQPGVIKYNSGAPESDSENMALKALRNFQYQELDGTIDYDKSGYYKIKIHLLGANPDLYNGHPVDFTFNINGHLPGLFKYLFMSGNFEQSILDSLSKGEIENLNN